MLNEYIAEAVGSFVFFAVILTNTVQPNPVMIAVALLIGILIASVASEANLNPAVTAMKYMQGHMNANQSIGYVASQLAGAIVAVQWAKHYGK